MKIKLIQQLQTENEMDYLRPEDIKPPRFNYSIE
jgi:hypothetical protein